MAKLNIAGHTVQVDDAFLKMAPDQQNAAVDEIAKSLNIGAAQPAPAAPQPQGEFKLPVRSFGRDMNDVVRALANGATFGLADRIAAGMTSLTGIGAPQRNLSDLVTGDNANTYADNLAREQAQTAQFNKAHPVEAAALNIAGSAAVPLGAIGAAARGATLGTKTLLGMGAGAGIGGVQGFASSPDWTNVPEAARNTAIGAGTGALIGGALPLAGAAIGAGYNKAADLFTGGVPGVSRAGSNHLISAVQADTPQAVETTLKHLGPDAMLADAGPALLGKAQGAALNSDVGRSTLVKALKSRDVATNGRIMGDVEGALGPAEDPQLVTNAIKATRSAADNVNYTKALNTVPPVDTTHILAELGPAIGNSVGMENKALTNLRGMLMTEKPFPVIDPVTGKQMVANGVPVTEMRTVPQDNPQILHKIKGELDNVIQYDQPGLGVPAGALSRQQGALKQFRGALNDALEQQVPGYAEANAASSALARRGEAVESGTQMLSSGKTTPSPERFAAEFGQMEPGEQIAFAKGNRGEIARLLGTKINDLQALKGALQGEGGWNTAKLATMYGQDTADQLTGTVERNLKFRDTYNKVVENSQTAQRNAAANAMKQEAASGEKPLIGPSSTLTGMAGTVGKKAVNAIIDAFRRDPTASYGDIASILSLQGPQRDRALQAIKDAIAKRDANAIMAPKVGNRAAVAAAILANDQLRNRLRRQ